MAAKMVVLLVFVLAAIAGSGLLSVQADSSCLNSLLSMTSCISYVSDESSEVSPLCCPSISAVLASQPLCLCYILNGEVGKLLGKPIDESRALGLPGLCKLTTPPISDYASTTYLPGRSPNMASASASADTGNTSANTGNTSTDTSNTSADTGNTSTDASNTSTSTGNTSANAGNTSANAGNTSANAGNTGTGTGTRTDSYIVF
ncbi:Non-specific lipid transfer protein GPI-anchored 2 [Ananas comosus]|uniref:Non-specific lipid transfer protein GPI-anchored 2 n=1 Tax=Ananas comosus TaxID=4615 RepID=A0A199VGC5_ANACO|nr:Non-specific lipid transfer protein GPI-anchored 2 [Ananas comosus]